MMSDGAIPALDGAVYFGKVMHQRLGRIRHRFTYRIFTLLFDIDQLPALSTRLRLFSYNGFNVFSFQDRDHGARDGSNLRAWVETHLTAAGHQDLVGGKVTLLCFPRILGFVFNPLSIFFCHDRHGHLGAILYEVANTFGERHSYLEAVPRDAPGVIEQNCAKAFYVSPFIELTGFYKFRVRPPAETMMVAIRQAAPSGQSLHAVMNGQRAPLDDARLVWALLAYPLMTLKVVFAIHWEALRLWRKGAVFQHRPPPPADPVSYGNPVAYDPLGTPHAGIGR